MTKDFNTFWAEFLLLASELKAHESTLIIELQQKLTPALSKALAAMPKPTNLMAFAEQCRNAYCNLQSLEKRMSKSTSFPPVALVAMIQILELRRQTLALVDGTSDGSR